jgi:hypothetical protein
MKSFLGFLKENSTLVDEGTFFSEDAAGKFDKKTLEDNVINKNVKLGYYLYFVEYRSISNKDINNVYFGIKNKRDSNPDALPENFFASLRWNGTEYSREDNIWKRNLLSCDKNGNCPIKNISKDGIYMSSSQPDSSKLGETLSQTYAYGIYVDPEYHPWIMNSKTFKTVQNAGGGKTKVKPYESKSGDIAPKDTSEYAYKMYVIEDMDKLDQAFNAALSDTESKVPQEIRKFYEESSKNLKNMQEFLIYYSSEWILGKKGYYETLIKFFDSSEFIKKYPKYKKLKTKEFNSIKDYVNFFKEQLKKNKWALVGTFEAYASRFMEDLLAGRLTNNPYVDDKNHYMKDKTFQKASSQIVVALDSYGWEDLYFPENTLKQIIPIEEVFSLYDTEYWLGKMGKTLTNKEISAAGDSSEKATINALKEKYGKGFTIADMFSFYYSGGNKIGKKFKDDTDYEKGKVFDIKTKTLIPISDKNKDNLLKILKDRKNIEKYKDDVLKIQKDFLYNLEFLKRNSASNNYEEIKLVVENNFVSNLLSNYLIEARKKIEVQGYYESGNIKNYNLKDFLADIFEIKGLPKNLTVDGLLKTRIKKEDGKESTVLQILKNALDKIMSGEKKVNVADSYEPNKDNLILMEEKNKLETAAIGLASNIIKSENSPHGHIYFDFNDKVSYLGKGNNLGEDKNDDGFMKLKKLIIGGTKLGSQHNNIFKR